jgi:hypothetical protein
LIGTANLALSASRSGPRIRGEQYFDHLASCRISRSHIVGELRNTDQAFAASEPLEWLGNHGRVRFQKRNGARYSLWVIGKSTSKVWMRYLRCLEKIETWARSFLIWSGGFIELASARLDLRARFLVFCAWCRLTKLRRMAS